MLLICTIGIVIGFFATFVVAGKICKVINRNTFGTMQAYIYRYFAVWTGVLVVYGLILDFTGILNYWNHLKSGEENTSNATEIIDPIENTIIPTEMWFDNETQFGTEYVEPEDITDSRDPLEWEEPTVPIEDTESLDNIEAVPLVPEYTETEETYAPPQTEDQTENESYPQESIVPEETYAPPQTEEYIPTEAPVYANFEGVWFSETGETRMDIVQQTGDTYIAKMYRTISENEMKYWELNASLDTSSDNRLNFDGTYFVLVSVDGTYINQDTGSPVSGYMTVNNGQLIVHYELNGGYYQVELYGPN